MVPEGSDLDPVNELPGADPRRKIREGELWQRFSEQHDLAARDELVVAYMPVAKKLASRYAGVAEPYDDLLQVASLGLVKAVERFDPSRGTPFVGFAKPTILGELKRHFRDKVWTVRVPRSIHDTVLKVEKAIDELSITNHRPPSATELARHLAVEPGDVLDALEAMQNRRPLSLDAPTAEDDEGSAPSLSVGGPDPGFGLVEDRQMLGAVLPGLDRREAEMLKLRFIDELPQTQIAERLGCSQMHVSRLLRRTLERLREEGAGSMAEAPADHTPPA